MDNQIWVVVGGADKGGLLVREGQETSSPEAADRVSFCAMVKELELQKERLRYELISGTGPPFGWVSTKLKGNDLLVPISKVWKVVGGKEKGGIVVRENKEVHSDEANDRLSTGAWVKEVELDGERLCYRLLTGTGPTSGWISTTFKGSKLAVMVKLPQKNAGSGINDVLQGGKASVTIQGRKLRILALHGKCSNSNIMKMQCAMLKAELGRDAEWVFADGPIAYDVEKEVGTHHVPTDIEKMVSRDKPFMQWYNHGEAGYEKVQEGILYIQRLIEHGGPIDIVVAFSMASNIISILLDMLRRDGAVAPWQLSILFNGGPPRDAAYQFEQPLSHPTIKVHGGKSDPYWEGGEPSLSFMYSDLFELGHEDGHAFPTTQPRAREIYKEIGVEVWRRFTILS